MSKKIERSSGLLMHISSLPNKHGVGTLGVEAYKFIDFLAESKQRYWQILPLGPTGYGNSPYQTYSIFAGNPLLISLEKLKDEALLTGNELEQLAPNNGVKGHVDYPTVIVAKEKLLKLAFERFQEEFIHWKDAYYSFLGEHSWWLTDYALFMALKAIHTDTADWSQWEQGLKYRDEHAIDAALLQHDNEVNYHRFVQFMFFKQWCELKQYANSNGVHIFGDIPLYVAYDSVDVWANRDIFELDNKAEIAQVGGVPPDYFSETGQNWGCPVFNWEGLRARSYDWWMARLHFNLKMFDLVRIDHFRGLASFWSIPAGEEDAIKGKWMPAKGREMLSMLKNQIGDLPIVAEDLGLITPDVEKLRDDFGLAGMKVLQFAYASDASNVHLPHNYTANFVAYTGTHDNDTTVGWLKSATKTEKKNLAAYYNVRRNKQCKQIIEAVWSSVASLAIIPMQDLLELDSESRMNTPGSSSGNWEWKLDAIEFKDEHRDYLIEITKKYNRIPKAIQ